MTSEKKGQIYKQWLEMNPGRSLEQFEAAFPSLTVLHEGETGKQDKITVRNKPERSMADVILERQKGKP